MENDFFNSYKNVCKELKKQCDQQVIDGELTEDEADFRYMMVRDEILIDMENRIGYEYGKNSQVNNIN